MARISRDARLETREARERLKKRHQPYWRQIHPGLSIGYRKGARGGVWLMRHLTDQKYQFDRIGKANDRQDANGIDVLDYTQAHKKALALADTSAKKESSVREDYTVADAISDYLIWYKAHRKAYRATELAINAHILPSLGKLQVTNLTARRLRLWHQKLAESPVRIRSKRIKVNENDAEAMRKRKASSNRILTVLKAALNHAWHEGYVQSSDAWRRVKPFRSVDAPKIRYLSAGECKRLLNACTPAFRKLVRGALLTGCRYGELVNMQCQDYNSDSGTVLIRESKSGKVRHIPLTDEGRAFFNRLVGLQPGDDPIFTKVNGSPWERSHQSRPMREACRAAKIDPPVTFHDLRHTYASLLAMRGVPLQVIAQVLGHSDTRMTEKHYAHLMPSYVADTIRANLPSFGVEKDNVEVLRQ